ncbi:MAG: HAD-IA family hydrolase [Sphingomonadales bacterium]|nr:HAD-IA family hydrolase [Sphingomonadales bacterium]
MIRLCLFDLDQTLVDTEDMQVLREAGKHRSDAAYAGEVRTAFRSRQRNIIDEALLISLQLAIQGLKIGIFTRSPRRYVDVVLSEAYALIDWDVVIAYEDVEHYKPNGEGIHRAMNAVGLGNAGELPNILMVGDGDVDIRAAYHAGCRVALFKKGWPRSYDKTHWRSLGLLPDLVLDDQEELLARASNPFPGLPDLERLLDAGIQAPGQPRFDEIGKFFPNDRTRHVMHAAGRYFPFHDSLNYRRGWHRLSQSIQDNKEALAFPPEWIETLRRFIAFHYRFLTTIPFGNGTELIITAIPARPERIHRLGHLIAQLQASYGADPRLNRLRLTFDPNVLAYRQGVQSQSHDHLTHEQRFANVRDHLYVVNPTAAQGKKFLVIDDVSTTGATLLYGKKYLSEAHANSVDCFTLAQTISDPLRYQ